MSHETITQVKRTLYVSHCKQCGDRVEVDKDPPRERYCNHCESWVPYEEVSYTGPELKG